MPVRGSGGLVSSWSLLIRGILAALRQKLHLSTCPNLASHLSEWVLRHMTPHPIATYDTPLRLDHPIGNGRPCTYVAFTSPAYAAPEPSRRWARNQPGWEWRELAVAHAAPATAPDEVAQLLAEIN